MDEKNTSKPKKGQENQENIPPNPNIFNILIVCFIITFAINILSGLFTANQKVEIDYNQFLTLVDSGYVERVTLDGDQLQIRLKQDADESGVKSILVSGLSDQLSDQEKTDIVNDDDINFNNGYYYTGYINDPGLSNFLYESGVSYRNPIVISNPITSFISSWIFPLIIFYVLYFFILRKFSKKLMSSEGGGMGGMGGFMNVGKSNAKMYDIESKTGVTFKDVAGQEEAKESLEEIIDFLHNPAKYHEIGAKQPKGALLVGPPGTGKTLIAKAVAGEAGVPFYSLSGSEFVEMFVGVGASRVRDLFQQANKNAPCIIFIDEIDAIGKKRDSQMGGNDEREQTLNQLLAEMDGFDSSKGIIILAATNRPEILDKALLRPGRFDRQIIVEKPDLPGREAILKVHGAKVKLGNDVNLKEMALSTSGATGADLANMVNEAALRAVKMGRELVLQEDLMESVELVIAGKEKKDRVLNQKEKRMVAYHEVGHALASALQKNAQPVQKITIVPRTMGSLGYTMNMPEEERYLLTKGELESQIIILLAGRSAEEIEFAEMTTGASNDIERATKLARSMVTQYGMSDKFDMMALESTQDRYLDGRAVMSCSEATGKLIDEEVGAIIRKCHNEAKSLIAANQAKLREISEFLLEKETISGEQFMALLNA